MTLREINFTFVEAKFKKKKKKRKELAVQQENSVIYVDVKRAADCITMALSHRVNIHTTADYGGKIMYCKLLWEYTAALPAALWTTHKNTHSHKYHLS